MPEVDLSTLNGPELKRLLKAARGRNDGPLAEQVEREIATRGAGGARPLLSPIAAHHVPRDVEDLDIPDLPAFQTVLPGPEPEARLFAEDALTLERPAPRRGTRRKSGGAGRGVALVGAGVVAGALITAGGLWGYSELQQQPVAPRLLAMTVRPTPASAPVQPEVDIAAAAEAAAEAATPESSSPAEAEPEPAHVATMDAPRPVRDPCARAATPADGLVCSDLALQRFDVELRNTLARARAANVDPVVLGDGQTAWRRARDEVTDRQRLARLYDARIRELDAATAQAEARPE